MSHGAVPSSSATAPHVVSFRSLPDLACSNVGGAVLSASDDYFASKDNLIKSEAPIFIVGKFSEYGKWMDGWESRRKRVAGYDHAVLRLGMAGRIHGFTVDTSFFVGNFPKSCSLEGAALANGNEEELLKQAKWVELVAKSPLAGGTANYFAVADSTRFTHVRFNIFPDGGVARLRVHGQVLPDWGAIAAASKAAPASSPSSKAHWLPEGYSIATPYVSIKNCKDAIEFYKKAFGATVDCLYDDPSHTTVYHAEIRINSAKIMVGEQHGPASSEPRSAGVYFYVPDVDDFIAKAKAAGAKLQGEISQRFYGDRSGQLADPFGLLWSFATHVEDVDAETMKKRSLAAKGAGGGEQAAASSSSATSSSSLAGLVDVACVVNGGKVVTSNDAFFGAHSNLILPCRAETMGDGWETRRKRILPGFDWIIVELGHAARVKRIEVDTNHFKGNFPDSALIEGLYLDPSDPASKLQPMDFHRPNDALFKYIDILPQTKLQAHHQHYYETAQLKNTETPITHVRMKIFPDGGISRLRVWGDINV